MLSAVPEKVVRERAVREHCPVNAFLPKPFRANELLESVRHLLDDAQ
jgi:hypothetical protein